MTVRELIDALGRLDSPDAEVVVSVNDGPTPPLGVIEVVRGGVTDRRDDCLRVEGEDPADYPDELASCWSNPVALIRVDTLRQLDAWAKGG